jgi:diaminopimelate decarboxylase
MSWSEFQKVLPQTARVGSTGALEVGGCDAVQLAAEFGTPVYVLDLAEVRDRLRRYRDAFGGYNVFYASKVFLTRSFAKIVAEEDVGMECLAGGELYVALAGGFPPERIALHGNNKSREELVQAIDAGVGRIVVDSFHELEMLRELTSERAVVQRILLRVTPGVEAHTHDYLVTGVEDTKFGFTIGEVAMRAIEMAARSDNLELVGLHSHIGSQIFDLKPFEEAARKMVRFLGEARRATALEIPELDLGGGLGISYLPSDEAGSIEDLAKIVKEAVASEAERIGTEEPTIKVEPGRSIVGPAMLTLYTVGSVKDLTNGSHYVAVDGGMSDNTRPALYQARYTFLSALRPEAPHDRETTIAGKLCETGDILGREVLLPSLEPGEIIACAGTGAYGYSMASNYNKQPKPAVVAVFGGEKHVLARRETFEDLVRLD